MNPPSNLYYLVWTGLRGGWSFEEHMLRIDGDSKQEENERTM